jgi:hypothetical protein
LSQVIRPQASAALPKPPAQSEADAASVVKAPHSADASHVDFKSACARGLARLLHKFVDVWEALANNRGELDARFTRDHLHLSGQSHRIWVDALRPHLDGVRSGSEVGS